MKEIKKTSEGNSKQINFHSIQLFPIRRQHSSAMGTQNEETTKGTKVKEEK